MPFRFLRLEIPDLILVDPMEFADERGLFMEVFKESDFQLNGVRPLFVQENYSHSRRGVLRGLHYQKHPKAQAKLVFVIRGEIFDVAVDLRRDSPTYGRWAGITLSEANHRMLYVPVGFAHGFSVVSEEADIVYKVTEEYAPELEGGIRWNDTDMNIAWPIRTPILSAGDARRPLLRDTDAPFVYERSSLT
jgi:dTDP-4-dehydrorhamnose 3,5-epimerase